MAVAARSQHRTALVLGAGGIVGVSYITGALAALEDVAGFDAHDADLIVGTSAGSVMGALLRSGLSASQLHRLGQGDLAGIPDGLGAVDGNDRVEAAFSRTFSRPFELARRSVGSLCTVGRALGALPAGLPTLPGMGTLFPSGLFTLRPMMDTLAAVLPETWPEESFYVCACDLATRRRTVFGTPSAPVVTPFDAVLASCSIPGFYEPTEIDGRQYVDGGVLSTTHLDLGAGYDLVIGVAPMAYDRNSARPNLHPARLAMEIYRRYPSRSLRAEMLAVREAGSRVLLIRPTVFEANRHGFNMMKASDRVKVAAKAYRTVKQSLGTGRFASVLSEFGYLRPPEGRRGGSGGASPKATAGA